MLLFVHCNYFLHCISFCVAIAFVLSQGLFVLSLSLLGFAEIGRACVQGGLQRVKLPRLRPDDHQFTIIFATHFVFCIAIIFALQLFLHCNRFCTVPGTLCLKLQSLRLRGDRQGVCLGRLATCEVATITTRRRPPIHNQLFKSTERTTKAIVPIFVPLIYVKPHKHWNHIRDICNLNNTHSLLLFRYPQ